MVETGIGIIASAIATLRPMYKQVFLGSTRGSSQNSSKNSRSQSNSFPWIRIHISRNSSRSGTGYLRSNESGTTDIKLEHQKSIDIGGVSKSGVTTLIESDMRKYGVGYYGGNKDMGTSPYGSETALRDEEDKEWNNGGIRKTTVTTSAV